MNMQKELFGFVLRRSRAVPSLSATLEEWEHVKSGARLCRLDREDENKSFAIGFRTTPEDDTGVFHIIEHSVLCGSDKYPVKEPFVELLKSSLQTFLNALTYPDKTVYPVASRNDQDFLNLVDVYMDAVLHPAIYKHPEIFYQEGWHVELTDKDAAPSFKGVVFNEMKGAYASFERPMALAQTAILFPDNCYAKSSGGDPEHITELSYEQFLAAHRRFYHPSNAYIILDGSIDLEKTFEKLNGFLAPYDRIDPHTEIPLQRPVPSAMRRVSYEVAPGEDKTAKTHISWNRVCGTFADKKKLLALSVLCSVLTGSNEAPLCRAILENGLGQEVSLYVDDGVQQPILALEVQYTEESNREIIEQTVRRVLTEQANGGLDHEELTATFNSMEFAQREHDFGGFPRGLAYGLSMLNTWLYDGDPIDTLEFDEVFAELRRGMNEGYFEELIRTELLVTDAIATVIAVPDDTLGEAKAKAEQARVDAICGQWTETNRDAAVATTQKLLQRQRTPDPAEALATIPTLSPADIQTDVPDRTPRIETKNGVTLLYHDTVKTDGILYLGLIFDASDVRAEDIPTMSLLSEFIGELGTAKTDARTLQRVIRSELGRFDVSLRILSVPTDSTHAARLQIHVNAAVLETNVSRAVSILSEVLNLTDFTGADRILEMLQQDKSDMEQQYIMRGNAMASNRRRAYQTTCGYCDDLASGYGFYTRLSELVADFEGHFQALSKDLERLSRTYFHAGRLTVSVAGKLPDEDLFALFSALPGTPVAQTYATFEPLGIRCEGIRIPAGIAFSSTGANLLQQGLTFSGHWAVAAQLTELTYLWNKVRVEGGAYGTAMSIARNGDMNLTSYRDPNPAATVLTDRTVPDFLESFCAGDEDLTPFIIGTIGSVDPLLTPRTAAGIAVSRYFSGISHEDVLRSRREILSATKEDLLALVPAIRRGLAEEAVCIVGSQEKLDACVKEGLIHSVLSL